MKNVQLIATDMDNTLLTSKGELPPELAEVIAACKEAGVRFGIASGRPLYTLKALFPKLQDELLLICDNGGMISDQGEIIYDSEITSDKYQHMSALTKSHGIGVPIICGIEAAYVDEGARDHLDYLQTFYKEIVIVPDLSQVTALADKFTIYFPESNAKDTYDLWVKESLADDYSVAITDKMWIDVMNKGVNKGAALSFISKKYDIPLENMMAFGDTYNDKEMLQVVGHSYLVANAEEDMRQYAKFTAPSNDEYGVLQIIKKMLAEKNNKKGD